MVVSLKPLDRIDRNILKLLQQDGRLCNVDVAQQAGLSPTPCLERVQRLKKMAAIASVAQTNGVCDPCTHCVGLPMVQAAGEGTV